MPVTNYSSKDEALRVHLDASCTQSLPLDLFSHMKPANVVGIASPVLWQRTLSALCLSVA